MEPFKDLLCKAESVDMNALIRGLGDKSAYYAREISYQNSGPPLFNADSLGRTTTHTFNFLMHDQEAPDSPEQESTITFYKNTQKIEEVNQENIMLTYQ